MPAAGKFLDFSNEFLFRLLKGLTGMTDRQIGGLFGGLGYSAVANTQESLIGEWFRL
jgi:hypothetical protein